MSKDVFVRKGDPFGRESSKNNFVMADYCSVLLFVKTLRDAEEMDKVDLRKVPLIRQGGLHKMPEAVCEEFDGMFVKVVKVLEEVGEDAEGFFNKLAMGDVDFVGDIVNAPEFTQAMGNFLMRKLRISKGYSMDEAFDEAKEMLPKLKQEMLGFIGHLLMECFQSLGQEATERGIPLKHASRLLHPRVREISRKGVMVETALDVKEFKKIQNDGGFETSTPDKHDPSFG